jgi:hypothetical protein
MTEMLLRPYTQETIITRATPPFTSTWSCSTNLQERAEPSE